MEMRPEIAKMTAYTPLDPVDVLSETSGKPAGEVIKLDGNENPYGPSPRVAAALAKFPFYHLYPDPEQRELRQMLAGYSEVDARHIVMGAGSDELIDLILRLYIEPGDKVVNCPPTFGMYPFSTEVCGGVVVEVKRTAGFGVDPAEVRRQRDKSTRVVFIASPNNPTGNITPRVDVMDLLATGMVVVVDEAYFEFSGLTVAHMVPHYGNLIVLRTFSKWAGLAGLRVGYALCPEEIAAAMMKIKQPYNINIAAQVAAAESLQDLDYLKGTVSAIVRERERLFNKLGELKWLRAFPSRANFILCRVEDGQAKKLWQWLKMNGIFIRYFDNKYLQDYIRITVGKPEHTDAVVESLIEFRKTVQE